VPQFLKNLVDKINSDQVIALFCQKQGKRSLLKRLLKRQPVLLNAKMPSNSNELFDILR
jgi:hypothetical protein